MILQRYDGGHHVERLDAGLESFDFQGDDGFGALSFLTPVGDVAGDRLLQVVDIVDENTIQLVHRRVYIAWHRDIDEEISGEDQRTKIAN